MQRKIVGALIILFGAIFLAAIFYYVFVNGLFPSWVNFWKKDSAVNSVHDISSQVEETQNNIKEEPKKIISFDSSVVSDQIQDTQEQEEKKEFFSKDDLKRIAESFVERFGSYSNQSNFSNIEDLEIYMTEKMRDWAENFIKETRGLDQETKEYFGITTKAIFSEVEEFDEQNGIAKIKVMTRRKEAKNEIDNFSDVYSQEIIILMKEVDKSWKVDAALWEAR